MPLLPLRLLNGVNNSASVGDTLAGGSGASLPLLLSGTGVGGGITETVTSQRNVVRTASDSVGAISETTTRTFGTTRTVADTVATLSETVARIAGHLLSASDTLAGSGGAQLPLLLNNSGVGTGITESLSTQSGQGRSVAQTLGAISETVAEDAVDARTVQDVITPITESAGRLATLGRSTTDTVAAISEAVVGVVIPSGPNNYTRTVSDSIAAISESVSIPVTGQGLEPAGAIDLRYFPEEPRHFHLYARDEVEFLDERIDDELTESDEWLVLDMPELVLT